MKYLVKFNDLINEVPVDGFKLMTEKSFDLYEELVMSITWPFSYPNMDGNDYDNGEDFFMRFELTEVSETEYKAIKAVFGTEYGTFPSKEFLNALMDDEDVEGDEPNEEEDGGDSDIY